MGRLSRPAVKALMEVLEYSEKVKPFQAVKRKVLAKYGLLGTGFDRLLTALMYKMGRVQGILDKIAGEELGVDVRRLPAALRQSLRLAVYLAQFDEVRDAELSDEIMVKLTGMLRLRFGRRGEQPLKLYRKLVRDPWKPKDKWDELELKLKLPRILIERLADFIGWSELAKFAEAVNVSRPVLGFRVNRLKSTVEEVLEELERVGVEAWPSRVVEYHVRYRGTVDYSRLSIVEEGKAVPQDEASTVAGYLLGAGEGEVIVDMCAAPGGKTTHLAELSANRSLIIAMDLYPDRLERLVELARRTGTYLSINIAAADATRASTAFGSSIAHRVLVDPPCSSTGALAKEPEARWRLSTSSLRRLTALQLLLLEEAAKVVRPGGRILYSVCSVLPEEGENVVQAFLSRHRNFELEPLDGPYDPSPILKGTMRSWPHRHETTGFFYALITRIR
ncbi:MAG: RsmB/NOP family class I SAM-dependent RNA methyltransferase [Thermoproteota archaeon]